MFEPRKILVPTDFSKYSGSALKAAKDMARLYHAKIYLLHVIDHEIEQCVVDWCLPDGAVRQLEEESLKSARERLEREASEISSSKGPEVEFSIRKGVPYDEILKEQKEKGIDLIVIASHGKSGFLGYLMGGVAQKVLGGSETPVLLIKSRPVQ